MAASEVSLQNLNAEDLNALNRCLFEWANSADKKDWDRFAANTTSEVNVDYSLLGFGHWPSMPVAEYVKFTGAPHFLGMRSVVSQHLLGVGYFLRTGPNEAEGHHQIRAAHQIYSDESLNSVKLKGHGNSTITHSFRKVDGTWKLAGVRPEGGWGEYNFEEVMKLAQG